MLWAIARCLLVLRTSMSGEEHWTGAEEEVEKEEKRAVCRSVSLPLANLSAPLFPPTHLPPLPIAPPNRSSREWHLVQPYGPHHHLLGAWTASSVLFASRPLLPSLLQATTPEHLRRLQQGWFVTAHTHTHLVFV